MINTGQIFRYSSRLTIVLEFAASWLREVLELKDL